MFRDICFVMLANLLLANIASSTPTIAEYLSSIFPEDERPRLLGSFKALEIEENTAPDFILRVESEFMSGYKYYIALDEKRNILLDAKTGNIEQYNNHERLGLTSEMGCSLFTKKFLDEIKVECAKRGFTGLNYAFLTVIEDPVGMRYLIRPTLLVNNETLLIYFITFDYWVAQKKFSELHDLQKIHMGFKESDIWEKDLISNTSAVDAATTFLQGKGITWDKKPVANLMLFQGNDFWYKFSKGLLWGINQPESPDDVINNKLYLVWDCGFLLPEPMIKIDDKRKVIRVLVNAFTSEIVGGLLSLDTNVQ